jgi:chromosome partitioning protein
MAETPDFLSKLYELLQHDELRKSLFVVLPTTSALGFWFGRHFPKYQPSPIYPIPIPNPDPDPRIAQLHAMVEDLKKQLAVGPDALERARDAVATTGPGLWLAVPPKVCANYHVIKSSIPIYSVANLKGGVGKTTIALSLASYFANPFGKAGRTRERVLLIDLDFQGSLSSMALTSADRIPQAGHISRATRLISGGCTGAELIQMHQRVKGLDALPNGQAAQFYAIPAYYDLAQAENRLMVEWLLSDGSRDIRYNLAEVLFSEEVQKRYDRIIIDAPPRLTTAHVQALAASTHVIIPTVLDQLSGEAVGSFVEQAIVHSKLWPHLKMLGVVGSMTEWDQHLGLQNYEQDGVVAIKQALEQKKDAHGLRGPATKLLPRNSFIPELKELGRAAGTRIGYLSQGTDAPSRTAADKLRRVFDSLGQAVVEAVPDARELKDLVRS